MLIGSAAADPELKDGYYQIGSASDLQWFASQVNAGHITYNAKLTADIDLSGVTWTSIGTSSDLFSGTFDGDGHSLSNLNIQSSDYQRIILVGDTAVVENVCFNNIRLALSVDSSLGYWGQGAYIICGCKVPM